MCHNNRKYNILIVICLVVLLVGSFHLEGQTSYSEFVASGGSLDSVMTGNTGQDVKKEETQRELEEKRTPEDIAIDKRLDAERKKNEKTYRESGMTGTSFPPVKNEPKFSMNDFTGIFNSLHSYMKEHPDEFAAPTGNDLIRATPDPRINNLLYEGKKEGIISGYTNENLIGMELKKLDGDYTILILGRKTDQGPWEVIGDGNVYQLREQMTGDQTAKTN